MKREVMTEEDKRCLKEAIDGRTVKVACGNYCWVRMASIVGFCHNNLHPGYLTIKLMHEHDCVNKNCSCFERFEKYPYWIAEKRRLFNKAKKRALIKAEKKRLREAEQAKERHEEQYKQEAIRLVEKYRYPIKIIGVHEVDSHNVRVFYVSGVKRNDALDYIDLAIDMHWSHAKVKFWIKRIVLPNGRYATFDDL